ncbi:MAG: MFS transporter [Flavobacteriales bacterium]|nr:MFS transporter [Flavobacteriales bacterium]
MIKLFKDSFSGISREVWLLSFVTLVNRSGAMVLPFLSLYLTVAEGYSLSTVGMILLFYGIGSFFGNYIGGILTDTIGAFRIQFLSLVVTAISFVCLSYLHSPFSFAIGLFCTSLLADTFRPANIASIAVLAGKEMQTKAIGLNRLAINLGFSAGPALGGMIAYTSGYEWLFRIDAISCFVAALLLLYIFRQQVMEEGVRKVKNESEEKPSMKLVLKDRMFLYFLLLMVFLAIVFMQLFNSLPVFYKKELLFDEDTIGLLMAYSGLLIVVLELPIIHLLEKRNKMSLIALGTILIGFSFFILLFDDSIWIALLGMTILTLGEILSLPFIASVIIDRAPERLRGRYLAFMGMAFSLCHMVAPLIGMQVATHFSFQTLWQLLMAINIAVGISYWQLRNSFTKH